MNINITQLAQTLDEAVRNRQAIDSLRTDAPFDLAQAYQIQEQGVALRTHRGERIVGVKLGFTSRAKMQQMGVNHLIWGVLTNAMQLEEGGTLDLSAFIHPRIEPEIGFITKHDISEPLNLAQAMMAIEGICAGLEIIDSRYNQFKFTLEDVVADNTSSAAFVLGSIFPATTPIDNCGVIMSINGKVTQVGSSAAILGHPLRALVQISHLLHEKGQVLPAGSIILAGAATAAEPLQPNQYIHARIHGLGEVSIHTGAAL